MITVDKFVTLLVASEKVTHQELQDWATAYLASEKPKDKYFVATAEEILRQLSLS